MSQTDNAAVAAHLSHVRIVMVNTTLPANIGSALRAMKTMGLCKLVLVAPKPIRIQILMLWRQVQPI